MKISIITITLNNLNGLKKTLESVFHQTEVNFEFIVIDGGSNDGTLETLKVYSKQISKWISEPDNGVFDAMNKGINLSSGEYLLFLNAGDVLFDKSTLSSVVPNLTKDIEYGDIEVCDPLGHWIKKYDEVPSFDYFNRDTLPHQAAFIKRSLFSKVGLYDETLFIKGDWKFFLLAICKFDANYNYLNKIICKYDYSGRSSQSKNRIIARKEMENTLKLEFGKYYELYKEMIYVKRKLRLLTASRVVRTYLKLRKFFRKEQQL